MVKTHLLLLKAVGSHRRALQAKGVQFGDCGGVQVVMLRKAPECGNWDRWALYGGPSGLIEGERSQDLHPCQNAPEDGIGLVAQKGFRRGTARRSLGKHKVAVCT